MNLLFTTLLHGNERAPHIALYERGAPHIICNPLATLAAKRFIERDMNASFGLDGESYEERRAREVLAQIPADKQVVDFHSFSCESPPFAIITDEKMIPLAKRTGLDRIVLMRFDIKGGHSLLSFRSGVAVEVGQHEAESSLVVTQKIMQNLSDPAVAQRHMLYEVVGTIERGHSYRCFEDGPDGTVIVLAGEKAYEHGGLKAVCRGEV